MTVISNSWQALRSLAATRIPLGLSSSLPVGPQQPVQSDHARDTLHSPLDTSALVQALGAVLPGHPDAMQLASDAPDRTTYLQRPGLGRRLHSVAHDRLAALYQPVCPYDLALVVVDGVSAPAITRNAVPFLHALLQRLDTEDWSLAPTSIVTQGRVAIGDEVGQLLGAKAVVVLVGERPGPDGPDSMGLCLTWAPQVGLTDAARNRISNVRPEGLSYFDAAHQLHMLLRKSRKQQLSGVGLQDEILAVLKEKAGRRFLSF